MVTSKLYPPQFYGGAEMSMHTLCGLLRERGDDVSVLAALARRGCLTWQNRLRRKLSRAGQCPSDTIQGYRVFRGWDPMASAAEVSERCRPQIVLAQSGEVVRVAVHFRALGLPVCVFLRHSHFDRLGGPPEADDGMIYIANSAHTASRYRDAFGLDPIVMPPPVPAENYRVDSDRSRAVYINPNPVKGIDVVLDLARQRPDVPFDIVESWTLPKAMTESYRRAAARLANVRWLPARSDMRSVYRHARVLLAPSGVGHPDWVEGWGRVATEAQVSGIPVLASDSGGLPEAVGPGGVVVPVDASRSDWVTAFSRLWDDKSHYQVLAQAAYAHAGRPEIRADCHAQRLRALFETHCSVAG